MFTLRVGVSSFRIDLGIIDPARPGQYILGVECDGATYHRARSARDRDRLRQEVLEERGWRLYRIWSTDWFRNPQRETDKLIEMIRKTAEPQRGQAPVLDQEEITSEELEDDAVELSPPNLESLIANRHLPSNVEDYRECALSVPVGRALLDLSVSELARLSRVVVEAEGPIHTEEVARRIREAFGLQKTGRRILTHIKNSLISLSRDGALMRDGEFWSVPGRSIGFIRNRRTAALPLRKPVMIAPAEYQLAICAAVKEAVALTRDDLVIQAARLFGFDRTGADLRQEIEQQVDAGIRAKAIIDDGQKMRMA